MRRGKRLFDALGAGFVLLISSPLLVVIGALVWKFHGWPILFAQERPGLDAKIFKSALSQADLSVDELKELLR